MSFGKSKARLLSESGRQVTFEDVAGCDEPKEELEEIIHFLKDPRKFTRLGGRIPKGVLLMGSPGTGKTLLARAVAGEAAVPFFSISGSDFVEMFGVGRSGAKDRMEHRRGAAGLAGDRQSKLRDRPAVALFHAFGFDVHGLNNLNTHLPFPGLVALIALLRRKET